MVYFIFWDQILAFWINLFLWGNKILLYSEIYMEIHIIHKLVVTASVNVAYCAISMLKNTHSCIFIILFTNL